MTANYKTIALLSHATKLLLNIAKTRLKGRIEKTLRENQFGFMAGRGTKEAILALCQIVARRI